MDLLNILPALESIARSINSGPLNDLLVKIHEIVDRIILFITPDAPVRDGGQALFGYADHFDTLKARLVNSKSQIQELYGGPAADQYYASLDQSLQIMQKMHDHLNSAASYHGQLAEHFLEASVQQGMIAAQAGIMAVDLGSLIFTGGLDAPVSVPVAAGDAVAAGGSMVAMDAAMTAAETTAEVIGESAADMGEMAFDLADEGSDALADAETLGDDGSILGDGGEPPPEDTPLDPSGNGGDGGGSQPPGDEPPDDPPDDGNNDNGNPNNPPQGGIDDAMQRLTSNANRLHHIFGQAKHLWDLTGLDQEGNLALIRQAVADNWQDVVDASPQPYEVTMQYGNLTVVVRGILQNGILHIADSWIVP